MIPSRDLTTLSSLKRWGDLKEAAKRVLATDPESAEGWTYLGMALFEQGEREAAVPVLEKACVLGHDRPWAYRMLSLSLQSLRRLDEAKVAAERAIELAPEDAMNHVRVSRLARLTGDTERAWEAAHRARELESTEAETWQNLGWNAAKEFRWSDAREYFEGALKLTPDKSAVHEQLGEVLKELGERERALEHFRRAVATDARRTGPYLELSQLMFEDGLEDEAFAVLHRARDAAPRDASVLYRIGEKCLMYDRNEEAHDAAQSAIDAVPRDPDLWNLLARCQERLGNLVGAEQSCARALELSPKSAFALRVHALSLSALGRHEEALARAREAVGAAGGEPVDTTTVATMLRRLGRYDEAAQTLAALLAKTPNVGWIWADVARTRLSQGDLAAAKNAVLQLVAARPKILRHWNLAARVAWHVGESAFLAELRARIDALPVEKSRFGKRLLSEAKLQCDLFAAMFEGRADDATSILERGLSDASRVDDFACSMVNASGQVALMRGEPDQAAHILEGFALGPHGTRACGYPDCPDSARLRRLVTGGRHDPS
jgi:tetratricopeptide (TPR) repeat protein